MSDRISELRSMMKTLSDKEVAETMQWFFKTGKGDYGEGDIFIGLKVPIQRKLASEFKDLSPDDIEKLLSSTIHEERLISLFILINKYQKADEKGKKVIFNFYLKNRKGINNWDLVDISAPKIVGRYLLEKDKCILFKFAVSKNLWERRIAILSTQEFIKNNNYKPTLQLAKMLIKDKQDLIHKAVGWMLREVGKKNIFKEKYRCHYGKTNQYSKQYDMGK